MKLCNAVQEGCGYKDTLHAHRYFAPLAKYFTVYITYQLPLVISALCWFKIRNVKKTNGTNNTKFAAACLSDATCACEPKNTISSTFLKYGEQKLNVNCNMVNQTALR